MKDIDAKELAVQKIAAYKGEYIQVVADTIKLVVEAANMLPEDKKNKILDKLK